MLNVKAQFPLKARIFKADRKSYNENVRKFLQERELLPPCEENVALSDASADEDSPTENCCEPETGTEVEGTVAEADSERPLVFTSADRVVGRGRSPEVSVDAPASEVSGDAPQSSSESSDFEPPVAFRTKLRKRKR